MNETDQTWFYLKEKFDTIKYKIRLGYKLVCNSFVTIHYVVAYETIHMYYLKKLHDSLNRSCD
jgi:hypothetical protein